MTVNAWNFDRLITQTTTSSKHMVFGGRDMWVLDNDRIRIVNVWDINTNYEGGIHSEYAMNVFDEITKSSYGEILTTATVMVKYHDDMLLISNPNGCECEITAIDISSRVTSNQYTIDLTGYNSDGTTLINGLQANGKLWLIFKDVTATPNKEYMLVYNLITELIETEYTFSNVQTDPRVIAWDNDKYVYALDHSTGEVLLFDTTTNNLSITKYVNLQPTSMRSIGNGEMMISSYKGLISTFNPTTDSLIHDNTTLKNGNDTSGMVHDGTYIWSIKPNLIRTRIGSPYIDNIKYQSSGATKTNDNIMDFGDNTFKQIEMSPEITYQWWDGTQFIVRTVKPYVFLLTDTALYAFRNAAMSRCNYIVVRATGMVATGDDYTGEVQKRPSYEAVGFADTGC